MNEANDITKATVSSAKEPKTLSLSFNSGSALKTALVIILIGLSFWLGFIVGHHNRPNVSTNRSSFLGVQGNRGRLGGRGGDFGTVTAISSTSITVQNNRTGSSDTYAITSSTVINDNGQSETYSNISTGETVIVIPSSSNSSDASRILVNPPSFGAPTGNTGTGSSTGSSTLN